MTGRGRFIVMFVLAVVMLTGCLSGEDKVAEADQIGAEQAAALVASEAGQTEAPAGEGGQALEFVAVDIDYSQAPDTAPAGDLTFALENQGSAVHNVVVEEAGDALVVEADGGESATGTIALEAGSYTYYCSIPGHRGAGMEGSLEVQ